MSTHARFPKRIKFQFRARPPIVIDQSIVQATSYEVHAVRAQGFVVYGQQQFWSTWRGLSRRGCPISIDLMWRWGLTRGGTQQQHESDYRTQ